MEDVFNFSVFGSEPLPLVVMPKKNMKRAEFLELIAAHGPALKKRLVEHGGLLFRGFPVEGASDFSDAIDALETGSSVNYIGGDSPRHKIKGAVYTSTEAPAAVKIPLHNELSFVRHYPKHIFFYCDVPPVADGETILGDARRIYKTLDSGVRQRFLERKLKYVSCYFGESRIMDLLNSLQPSHKSWHDVFETNDRAKVEELCRTNDFDFDWPNPNWIRISQTRPAAIQHPETGEWVWFCQPHLYDFSPRLLGLWRYVGAKIFYAQKHTRLHEVFHADGSKVAREDLYHLLDTLDRNTVKFPWKHGDVLVLDNVLSMHGRATFAGKRRILAAMTS
jgi:alpha-ketoglutarate-dependent taurine dioxygenase